MTVSIAPWLSVADATTAVDYYKAAFGAVELERLEDEAGHVVVARLSIAGADFWVQQDDESSPEALAGKSPVRMILTVTDPDAVFAQALMAGATEVAPIHEEQGWRIGRVADPSGHHWEIGKPLSSQLTEGASHPVFRHAGISYMHIPAQDPRRSAAFYQAVFGWNLRGNPDWPSFDDGTGHVIGAWVTDRQAASDAGVLPYVYVHHVDEVLERVTAHGGEVVRAPYPEGDLWVAAFRDPAGNEIGVWQRGPR